MNDIQNLSTRKFLSYAKRQARSCFLGMVTDSEDKEVDGIPVTVNTVRKFNRKALLNPPKVKKDRPVGDASIIRVGDPGSPERLAAYVAFYAANGCDDNKYDGNISPFMDMN